MPPIVAERPANSGLLQFGVASLRSRFPGIWAEFGESLWLTPRIFPFMGDAGRRLGSIMDCVVRAACNFAVRRARTPVKRNNLRGRGAIPTQAQREPGAPTFNNYPIGLRFPRRIASARTSTSLAGFARIESCCSRGMRILSPGSDGTHDAVL
jgi:hypothetical protein